MGSFGSGQVLMERPCYKAAELHINPLKSNFSNCYTLPYRSNLPFLISDIRALWHSGMSEIKKNKNGMLGLYDLNIQSVPL